MRFLVHLILFFVPLKSLRKRFRGHVENFVYGWSLRGKAKSVGVKLHIKGLSSVTRKTVIGDCVSLGGLEIYGGGECEIGNYVHVGPETLILTQNHNYEGKTLPYDSVFLHKKVVIGEAVWIGTRVTILPGTHIGEGAIIQAGSVVHGEIPPCAIAGGNPAKVFAWRNKEHYEKLKAAGAYYRKDG